MDSDELKADYARKQYELGLKLQESRDANMKAEDFDARLEKAEPVQVFFPRSQFMAVKEFHEHYAVPVGDKPHLLNARRAAFRRALIEEEFQEFLDAVEEGDLVNAAKELADLAYVVNGTAVEMGFDLDIVVRAVHKSNMSKLGADGKPIYREDGKVLKGPNYVEPNIAQVLYPESTERVD